MMLLPESLPSTASSRVEVLHLICIDSGRLGAVLAEGMLHGLPLR